MFVYSSTPPAACLLIVWLVHLSTAINGNFIVKCLIYCTFFFSCFCLCKGVWCGLQPCFEGSTMHMPHEVGQYAVRLYMQLMLKNGTGLSIY